VAPETAILSTRSSECEPEEGMGFNEFYMYLHGTSMATPLTAGAVAPIREHLRKVISDNSIFSADKGCPDSLGEPEGVQVFFCKYRDRICGTLSRDGVTWT
jgi:hypothetical protein